MLTIEKNQQNAISQILLENERTRNSIKEHETEIKNEQELWRLQTERKLLEKQANANTRKAEQKKQEKSLLKQEQYKKQNELVKETQALKKQEDQSKQDILIAAKTIDESITPEDIEDEHKFNEKMANKQVECQKKQSQLDRQRQLIQDTLTQYQTFDYEKVQEEQNVAVFFVEHPVMKDYAENQLGYKTVGQKYENLPSIVKSFNQKANEAAVLTGELRALGNEEANNFLSGFDNAFLQYTGKKAEDVLAQYNQYTSNLETQVAESKTIIGEKLNTIQYLQTKVDWLYNNSPEYVQQAYDNLNSPG